MKLSRRNLVMGALAISAATGAPPGVRGQNASETLVAFLTRSGNTRVIAGQISRDLGAALFEIRASQPYPADYEEMVAQAERERVEDYEPPLVELVDDFLSYRTVFLAFPIWGMTAPSVIRSFLSNHDLTGKRIIPVITHGGNGVGNSLDVVRARAPEAEVLEGFSLECDQERRTMETVRAWLADLGGV